ncbi:MAG TPA: nucleotidyltransferase family protein [Anaeromyxobacter sp.]|nr:nucleotidyltransferase family protein [Anaeromyxobacter sp.]
MDPAPGEEFATRERCQEELDARSDALRALAGSHVPSLVSGAYAFFEYTGIFRDTKDLDLFIRERDLEDALAVLESAGFRTHIEDPTWIAKGFRGEWFVDLIFSSGNGVAVVDDLWFEHARPGRVMGVDVLLSPPEEMIWSKAFVLERERYDGADVNHLVRAMGEELDWDRILFRFDRYWEVLLSHLLLFRFAYPGERCKVPDRVMETLLGRAWAELGTEHPRPLCRGNLISRVQYGHDLTQLGYEDGRRWDELDRASSRTTTDGGRERDLPAGGGR